MFLFVEKSSHVCKLGVDDTDGISFLEVNDSALKVQEKGHKPAARGTEQKEERNLI